MALEDPVFNSRADAYRKLLTRVIPLAIGSGVFFHGLGFRRRWNRTLRSSVSEFALLTCLGLLSARIAIPVLAMLYTGGVIAHWLRPAGDQPFFLRKEYPCHSAAFAETFPRMNYPAEVLPL